MRKNPDWLIGINATRLFSVLYHKTLPVGRVQTPTLKMLADRDAKITGFQKEKYHIVHIAGGGMEAASDRFPDPAGAESVKTACMGAPGRLRFHPAGAENRTAAQALRPHHLAAGGQPAFRLHRQADP